MPFTAHEVARTAGISKNTLLRWLKQGKVPEPFRDRNGWRVFQQDDVDRVCAFANRTSPPDAYVHTTNGAAKGSQHGEAEAA